MSLRGRVFDEDTRKGLFESLVKIEETGVLMLTDQNGQYLFKGLCPGYYNLTVSHVGCITQKLHIHIKEDVNQDFFLPHASNELSDVVVIGYGTASKAVFAGQVKGLELDRSRGLSLAESMRSVAGVSILQTGTNIYKPIINGLHSNRVLILNNGIRQEGQQWGSEHAPEVDPFVANRITIIKGASSLRYGGDAIGGVVLVEPRLLPASPGLGGEINMAGFSNNRQGVLSAILEGNSKKHPPFSWRIQGTLKRGGYARTPDYWLANSGSSEYNFSVASGWKTTKKGIELFGSQFNTKLGIYAGSHIGNVRDLENAISSGEPPAYLKDIGFSYNIGRPYQQVQHSLGKVNAFIKTGDIGRLNMVLSGQFNRRQEYDVLNFSSSNPEPQLDMDLSTWASELVWDHYEGKKWKGTIGMNFSYQRNLYFKRFFIPNYEAVNLGAFAIEKLSLGPWLLEAGIRADTRSVFNTDRNGGQTYEDQHFSNISGNTSATCRFAQEWTLSINLSTAWRAPQVNELYSDGLHHGAARIEKGNNQLNAERANSVMAGLNHTGERLSFETSIYAKYIADFIYLKPTFPPQLTIRGAFPTYEYDQTDARLTGIDFMLKYRFGAHLHYSGKLSMLRAWDQSGEDWLVQMPSDRFENQLEYQFPVSSKLTQNYVRFSVQSVLEQTRVPASGNIVVTKPDGSISLESDYAPPPPAYHLTNLELSSTLLWGKRPVQIMTGASNLFNVAYRDYLNAFRYFALDMGINFYLRIKIPFNAGSKV